MKIKIKKLDSSTVIPCYAHRGDAGMDFYSRNTVHFLPSEQKCVYTGIAIEIPEGYVGLIWDKSSISFKFGLKVIGGVIDSGHEKEVFIFMINNSNKEVVLEKGQKVAQMIIQKFEICDNIEIGN
ncbi:MAG: Deoxyuridine 5'-triphosphate nucleotidohydrolase [Candidatus Nomurabacteria bacterium GW2011_GWD2_39_12]|uniref:dUTP diphosphatase n=1 Tax=Candidatus Nomurabacteria bacterium GW2011_GWD2_39_12 TaxID=1618759 RepID=A0A837HRB6_9BACT|nr:MAG: Deoxyuridine 5'-triphosphate nucleotidohydrolase [Candidatus Nomurabacteria bacterium GW2011_GWD2_39_12]